MIEYMSKLAINAINFAARDSIGQLQHTVVALPRKFGSEAKCTASNVHHPRVHPLGAWGALEKCRRVLQTWGAEKQGKPCFKNAGGYDIVTSDMFFK